MKCMKLISFTILILPTHNRMSLLQLIGIYTAIHKKKKYCLDHKIRVICMTSNWCSKIPEPKPASDLCKCCLRCFSSLATQMKCN